MHHIGCLYLIVARIVARPSLVLTVTEREVLVKVMLGLHNIQAKMVS